MPATVNHVLTATTPDNPAYEVRPSHWNSAHSVVMNAVGSEISGAFSNANGLSWGLSAGMLTGSHNGLTTAAASNHSHGFSAAGGSSAFQTLSFSNGNGVTFTNTNGQVGASVETNYQSAGAYLTTAAQSNQVVNSVNGSTGQISLAAGSSLSSSQNGSSITFGLASNITTALQPAGAYLTTAAQSNQVVNSLNASTGAMSLAAASSLSMSTNGSTISFGLASNITTALQSAGAYLTTAAASNHSHGNPTLALTNLSGTTASNSAGLTLSLSALAALTSQSNQNITAGNGGFAFQTLSFSNAQGVTFATSAGSAIVASVETSYAASNHSHGNPTLALTNLTGTTASASNGFTLSLSAGAGGAFSAGVSNVGNSLGQTGVTGTRLVLAGGNNVTLSQATDANGATITVSGANLGGAQTGISSIVVSNATYTSGAVSFSNANGISFGSSAGQAITASYTVPTSYVNALNGSSGAMSLTVASSLSMSTNGSTISFGLASNITTALQSAGAYLTTAAVSNHSHGFSAAGGSSAFQTLNFSNGGGVSFTNTNGQVGASVETSYAASNHSHGNPTLALTNLSGTTASASNGFTLSLSALAALTSQSNQNITAGNGGFAFQTLSFSNAQGVTFATSAGSAIFASVETSYAASNHSHGNPTLALTNLSGTTASASNGFTLSLSALAALTSQSNQNITAANGGFAFQTLSMTNANGVSFGTSAGSAIFASVETSYAASNHSHGNPTLALTNLSGTTASNSAGFTLSLSAGVGGGVSPVASASNGSFSFTTLAFSNANNVTFGTSAGSIITASVAAPGAAAENNNIALLGNNTAGNTTASGSTIGFSGINLTLSGTNASVVNISAPATSSLVAGPGILISTAGSTITLGQVVGSYFDNMAGVWPNSTAMQFLQSTSHVQCFVINQPLSFGVLRIPMSAAMAASSTAATTGNTQFSYGHSRTHNFVIYSRGTGASSQSLQSVASTSFTDGQSHNISANANSTQFSYSNRFTYWMSTGTTGITADYSSSAASLNYHTSGLTAVTGQKVMEFPWATSLAPGRYWLMYGVSTTVASQFTNVGTVWYNRFSNYGMSQPNLAFGPIGAATNNSVGPFIGLGSFSTAGGGTTASLPISAVTTSGSHNKMFFALNNIA